VIAAYIIGFKDYIFAKPKPGASDIQVVQKQLQGFALLAIGPFISLGVVLIGVLLSGKIAQLPSAVLNHVTKS
jgi:hypothetical protein